MTNIKNTKTITYMDGVEFRWTNRRVVVRKNYKLPGSVILEFTKIDKTGPDDPKLISGYHYKKGRHITGICISNEAMEGLFHSIHSYLVNISAKELLNSEQNVQECDARDDASSTEAGK